MKMALQMFWSRQKTHPSTLHQHPHPFEWNCLSTHSRPYRRILSPHRAKPTSDFRTTHALEITQSIADSSG